MAVSVVGGFVRLEALGEVLGFLGRREPQKFNVSPLGIEFPLIIKVIFYCVPGVTSRHSEVLVGFDNVARQFAKQANLVEICPVNIRRWIVMIRKVFNFQGFLFLDGLVHALGCSAKFLGTVKELGGESEAEAANFLIAQAGVALAIEPRVVERTREDGTQSATGAYESTKKRAIIDCCGRRCVNGLASRRAGARGSQQNQAASKTNIRAMPST